MRTVSPVFILFFLSISSSIMSEPQSTRTLKIVTSLCDEVQNNSMMAGLIGLSGNGKSTALIHACRSDYKRVRVVMGKSFKAVHLYQQIYKKLRPAKRSIPIHEYNLIQEISEFLDKSENRYLIILDEAGKATPRILELFHELRENTYEKCGFIFAAPPYFKSNLAKWINDDKPGMVEFARRIEEWITIDSPTKSEMTTYCMDRGFHDRTTIQNLIKDSETFSDLVYKVNGYFRDLR